MADGQTLCLLNFLHHTEERLRVLLIENVEYIHELRYLMPGAELFVVTADEETPAREEFQNMDLHWVTVNFLAERLPLEEDFFDIVMGENLFLEAWNPQDIASGLGNYLKETGFLLTSFTNARYWRNIRDLRDGHFYHVCTHVFTRNEMMSLLGASFYKDASFLPVQDEKQPDKDFIAELEKLGFENDGNDLAVRTWLVRATKSIAEVLALKKLYTKEIRRELSNRLRHIEYGIEVRDNVQQLWRLFEEKMIFPEYVADFVYQAVYYRQQFAVSFARELCAQGHEDWARKFLQAMDMPETSKEAVLAQSQIKEQAGAHGEGAHNNLETYGNTTHDFTETQGSTTQSADSMESTAPENKIAFITCINKEEWYQECQLFINNLEVPTGMEVELVPVRGAKSMCQGYNMGMQQTNAKYKVYLHQDTFIANKHFIRDVLQIFEDKNIGALGVIGVRNLPETGIWWDGLRTVGRVLHACEAESVVDSTCLDIEGPYVEVEAVDGLILVTQVDLPWREDLFTGWHFYEISQCMEMRRHGYRVVVPNQETGFWCIHCPKEKPLDATYKQYQKIFLKEYGRELHPEI